MVVYMVRSDDTVPPLRGWHFLVLALATDAGLVLRGMVVQPVLAMVALLAPPVLAFLFLAWLTRPRTPRPHAERGDI